jgi:hypothetical protein
VDQPLLGFGRPRCLNGRGSDRIALSPRYAFHAVKLVTAECERTSISVWTWGGHQLPPKPCTRTMAGPSEPSCWYLMRCPRHSQNLQIVYSVRASTLLLSGRGRVQLAGLMNAPLYCAGACHPGLTDGEIRRGDLCCAAHRAVPAADTRRLRAAHGARWGVQRRRHPSARVERRGSVRLQGAGRACHGTPGG